MKFEEILPHLKNRTLVDNNRLKVIYDKVLETSTIEGAMAEIGVYKGGTSYLIAAANPNKTLFSCDSFEGLPETTKEDYLSSGSPHHYKGQFLVSYDEVYEYLNPLPNIALKKGFFPDENNHSIMYNWKYSFVHLDVDLYKPTLDCLNFFWPRMNKGGIIVSDDYTWKDTPGVDKAFHEFFPDVHEINNTGYGSCWVKK